MKKRETLIDKIKRMYYEEETSINDIAKEVGLSVKSLNQYFKKYQNLHRSLEEGKRIKQKLYEENEQLVFEFKRLTKLKSKDDFNLTIFCDDYNLNYNRFYSFIRKYHHEIDTSKGMFGKSRRKKESCNNRRKLRDSDLSEVKHLYYEDKKTYKEIGAIFGCRDSTVCLYFKKFGLEPRTKSENGKMVHEKFPKLIEWQRINSTKNYLKRRKFGTKPEKRFAEYCTANSIEFIEQYRKVGNAHPYDFFLPEYNTIVEIDGTYWHTKPEQIEKDKIQTEQALEKGYNVIRIDTDQLKKNKNNFDPWYNEIKRMERFNGERKRGRLLEVE